MAALRWEMLLRGEGQTGRLHLISASCPDFPTSYRCFGKGLCVDFALQRFSLNRYDAICAFIDIVAVPLASHRYGSISPCGDIISSFIILP